jgi:lysophospholipase L1-like esterase
MKRALFLIALISLFGFAQPKETTWVAIGDSITYLNDHLNETGNRVTKGYMTRITEQLPYIHYTNQGHNGWTSGDIAGAIDTLGLTKADVYSIFLGTNDWWSGRALGSLTDYQNNTGNNTVNGSFRIIVDKLKQLNKSAKIILITPMQRADFVYINNMKNNAYGSYKEKNGQSLSQFAAAIEAIGQSEDFTVIDLYNNRKLTVEKLMIYKRLKDPKSGKYKNYHYPRYVDIPFNPETDEYPYPPEAMGMTYDGLHPLDKGNAIIADLLVTALKEFNGTNK